MLHDERQPAAIAALAARVGAAEASTAALSARLEQVADDVDALLQPDPESRTPDHDGRRILPLGDRSWGWRIVNYVKYRQIKREQDRRDYHREYYHSKRKQDSTPSQHASTITPIAEAKANTEADGKKNNTAPRKRSASPAAPDGVSPQVWADWLALRKVKKAAVTETAIEGINREAQKAGLTLQAALEACCANGWQGFKAEWLAPKNGHPQTEEQRQSSSATRPEHLKARHVRALSRLAGAGRDAAASGWPGGPTPSWLSVVLLVEMLLVVNLLVEMTERVLLAGCHAPVVRPAACAPARRFPLANSGEREFTAACAPARFTAPFLAR